jgi:predicted metal-binding membrane protein
MLASIAVAAWLCFIRMSLSPMHGMPGMAMPSRLGDDLAMWEVMVVAMMTPTLFLVLPARARSAMCALVFTAGYLCVWSGFALAAAIAQHALEGNARWVLLALLAAGGLYQWTLLKKASLDACRDRARMAERTPFVGGLRYGACCLGCCWLLMASMAAVGMSNIAVLAGVTLAMLGERLLPRARHATGAVCVALALGLFFLGRTS